MKNYAYGHMPPDIGATAFGLSWLAGVRHLQSPAAGKSFWHEHAEMQIMHCFKGEFEYEFDGHPPAVLTTGHYIVIPANLRHRHMNSIDPAGHRIELLVRKPSGRPAFSFAAPSVVRSLIASIAANACRPIATPHPLALLFKHLDALAAQGAKALSQTELSRARALAALSLHACADSGIAVREERVYGRVMGEATAWLEGHFAEDVKMDSLVDYMGYSRSHLFELFRKHTGLSPAEYLARYRIGRARRMLENTDDKVLDIANACGFSSAQYFNAAFRRQTGLTPSEWRARHRRRT